MNAKQANSPVVPFSNGSSADYWQEMNCGECARCPPSSPFHPEHEDGPCNSNDDVRAGACQLSVRLEMGFFEGSIPAKTAWRIGARTGDCRRSGNTVFVTLPSRCNEFKPYPEDERAN